MKKITKAIIAQQLATRFRLQEYLREDLLFAETVQPVYELQPLLLEHVAGSFTALTTGIGETTAFTVPANQRWTLLTWSFRHAAEAHTIAYIYIVRAKYATGIYLIYENITAGMVKLEHLPQGLVLEEGDSIRWQCSAYTVSGYNTLDVSYILEIIR